MAADDRSGATTATPAAAPAGDGVHAADAADHAYRVFVEEMPDGAAAVFPDGTIAYANPRLAYLLQMPAERLIGTRLVEHVDPGSAPALAALLAAPRAQRDLTLRTASGVPLPAYVSGSQAEHRGQRAHYLVITDLTSMRRAQADLTAAHAELERRNDELTEANKELSRYNEELQRFAYVASHDLQEPLRKIISFSGLLAEHFGDELTDEPRMYLDRLVGAAQRMRQLIDDLLRFSRAGQVGQVTEVDLEEVLADVLESLDVTLRDTAAVVTADPLPVVQMARTHAEQLLQNLIGNAVKYRGDEPPRIHVGSRQTAHGWQFTVVDNGIGLDMAYRDRIFQVFQRLHGRHQYPGTGIGLALCKRVAETYGGRIWVESAPDQGATFTFTLHVPGRWKEAHG